MRYWMGIDPGVKGASVVLNEHLVVEEVFSFAKGDETGWLHFIEKWGDTGKATAFLERVHSFPRMGVRSAFTFGHNFGFLRGSLMGLRVPTHLVKPVDWQTGLNLPKRKTHADQKRRLLSLARQTFPSTKWTLDTADAALIAMQGPRVLGIR